MNLAVFELGIGVVALAGLILWVWALVDVLKRPATEWKATGQNQFLWLAVVVLLPVVGSLAYLFTAGSRRRVMEPPATS